MTKSGRRALVTGGGGGIGSAIVHALRESEIEVVITGRHPDRVGESAERLGASGYACDLRDADAIDGLIAAAGPIDILVNNAGMAVSAALDNVDDGDWEAMLMVNCTAAFRLCRGLVPAMKAAGYGRIINIASNAGVTGYRYSAAYCASKHGMIGFTRALAAELATTKITVNAVCPGFVDTPMADQAVSEISQKTGRTAKQARESLEAMSPQRRLIEPNEVAHMVSMLASPLARGVNGQAIVIDGGQVMK